MAALVVISCSVLVAVAMPVFDRTKTCRPFFDEISPAMKGRSLYTTIRNDRELSLANDHLKSRFEYAAMLDIASAGAETSFSAAIIKLVDLDQAKELLKKPVLRFCGSEHRKEGFYSYSVKRRGGSGKPSKSTMTESACRISGISTIGARGKRFRSRSPNNRRESATISFSAERCKL